MTEQMRISGKDLGALALPDFCPRCFWIKRHAPDGVPYQVFPGIFSSIDAYSKHVIHGWFDRHGGPPPVHATTAVNSTACSAWMPGGDRVKVGGDPWQC